MHGKNNQWIQKGVSLFCCAAVLFGCVQSAGNRPVLAYADVDALQSKIDALEKENSEAQKKLDVLKEDIANQEKEQKLLEKKRDNAQDQVVLYAQKLGVLEEQIAQNEEGIAEKEQDIADHTELFGQRIRAMYLSSQTSAIELLLQSKSFSEFLSHAETMRRISIYDNKLIDTLNQEKGELYQLQTTLDKQQTEAELTRQKYLDKVKELEFGISEVQLSKDELEKQKAEYLSNIQENEREAAKLEEQTAALIKKYEEQERKRREEAERKRREEEERRKQQEALNNQTQNNDQGYNVPDASSEPVSERGFVWPCPSSARITSYFGSRVIFGVQSYHGALDIAAPKESAIVAAKSGTVIAAGPSGTTYGTYVIISHGDGYSTLYAHCNSVDVSVGQQVKQGQRIAGVGTTGRSTGYHLHFEVRENGVRVNPLNYVSKPW